MNEEETSMVIQEMEKKMEEKDQKLKELNEELEAKCDEIEYLKDTISALATRDGQNTNEILAASKEGIKVLQKFPDGESKIGIKKIGELDEKPFMKACNQKFNGEEVEMHHAMLCSVWGENVRDPNWHPFKRVMIGNHTKEVVDEDDEELKNLREEWGEDVKNAVKTSLEELNEYNPSGGYVVKKLWNFEENREATLEEVIAHMGQQIKDSSYKRKRI